MRLYLRSVLVLLFSSFVLAQAPQKGNLTETVSPGDNLVTEGIPPIPASLAEQAQRYSEMRSASFRSWHPSRREMLIVTRFGDTYQIHRVKAPGAARTQLTFFPERVSSAQYEPVRGEYFIYSKDKGGDEFYQIYRYDMSTGDSTLLTDGKSRNTDPVISNKAGRIVYGSTHRNGNDVDLWTVEPRNPNSNRMLAELKGGGWMALDWSPDDRQILVMEEVSINETYLWLTDAQTGKLTLLTPKENKEKIAYGNAKFSRDGRGVYLTTDKDFEFRRLAYLDLRTKQLTFLTSHIRFDIDGFDLSFDGSKIAFVTNENGANRLHLLDTRTRKERPAPKLPVSLIFNPQWHKNNRDLAFDLESSRSTLDAYSLDVQTGRISRWTESETGGLNTNAWPEARLIRWTSFDSREITGFLYRPPARFTGRRPVVIDIHGGPESQSQPEFLSRDSAFYVNELGIAMIFPNVRGSSGFGKTYVKLDNGFLRENSYKDIDALLDWVRQQPDLDANRIMVIGGSYGGHMVLATSAFYADKIRCAVDVVGISNLVTFLENTSGYRRDLRRVEYGDERDPKMRAYLERIAPMNNVAGIKKPLFVIQGANDPRVPRSEAEQMVAAVRKNGTPVWYLLAKDEGHGFAKKKNRDFEFYSTILFMKEYLLGLSNQ